MKRLIPGLSVALAAGLCHAQYAVTVLHPMGYKTSAVNAATSSVQAGWGVTEDVSQHALIWEGTAGSVIDLHPSGMQHSLILGAGGDHQVGAVMGPGVSFVHAYLWSGSAASAVDLNPEGMTISDAYGVSDRWAVGSATLGSGDPTHAWLWDLSDLSWTDLTPTGVWSARAYAVYDEYQVGSFTADIAGSQGHGVMWHGTPESRVDLNPDGYQYSQAVAMSAHSQGGTAGQGAAAYPHAMLWHGSAASAVDLNPDGFNETIVNGLTDEFQVGWGIGPVTNQLEHALLWTGTAGSYVDLNPFIEGVSVNGHALRESVAQGIDDSGNIVGYASDIEGNQYAVMWQPVPGAD